MSNQITKAGQSLIVNGMLTTIATACTTALISGDSVLPDAALIGFGLTAGASLLANIRPKKPSRRRVQMTSIAQIAPIYPDMNSFRMKWKPDPELNEFVFDGLGLPVAIHETTLMRFLKIARRRQTSALYDGKNNRHWTGGGYSRIKINWVLSEMVFTKRCRPRFPQDEYDSIIMVLGYTRLLLGRYRGSSGRLVGDYGIDRYAELAKSRWFDLINPPPRRNFPNFLRHFYN